MVGTALAFFFLPLPALKNTCFPLLPDAHTRTLRLFTHSLSHLQVPFVVIWHADQSWGHREPHLQPRSPSIHSDNQQNPASCSNSPLWPLPDRQTVIPEMRRKRSFFQPFFILKGEGKNAVESSSPIRTWCRGLGQGLCGRVGGEGRAGLTPHREPWLWKHRWRLPLHSHAALGRSWSADNDPMRQTQGMGLNSWTPTVCPDQFDHSRVGNVNYRQAAAAEYPRWLLVKAFRTLFTRQPESTGERGLNRKCIKVCNIQRSWEKKSDINLLYFRLQCSFTPPASPNLDWSPTLN